MLIMRRMVRRREGDMAGKKTNLEFGKWLAAQREAREMTRNELADALGISYPYVSQLETGYRLPSTNVIAAIRTALDVSADEIYAVLYPPTMVDEPGTMELLRATFVKHPRLAAPGVAKVAVVTCEIDGPTMELGLSDGTTVTLSVDRRANEVAESA
jgi:transcriptional regulator with XRE-family HTH domain